MSVAAASSRVSRLMVSANLWRNAFQGSWRAQFASSSQRSNPRNADLAEIQDAVDGLHDVPDPDHIGRA
jgi:hypothetical protein